MDKNTGYTTKLMNSTKNHTKNRSALEKEIADLRSQNDLLKKMAQDTEAILHRRIGFEELIAALSTIFINFPGNRLDELISYSIKKIAEFSEFDRGYIYMFSNKNVTMDLTHEWCRQVDCRKTDKAKSVMAYEFPWVVTKLNRQENIQINSLDEIPMGATSEIEFFKTRGIKSLLIVPLVYNQSLTGFLGFESYFSHKHWSPEDVRLMNMVAEIIINAYKRKWSEKALQESEERFREIYEKASLGIYRYTTNHILEMANPALLNMLGYDSFDEISLVDLRSDIFVNYKARNQFENLLRRNGSADGYETQWRSKDGSMIEMSESARIIKDDNGRIRSYEGFIENITVKKKAREKLIEAKELAEKSNKLKSDFLQQMSHEIRTPITAIINNSNMLKFMVGDDADEMIKQQFNNITVGGMRIIRTVDLIINMSELQSGSYKPDQKEFDLFKNVIIKQVENFGKLAEDKGITLTFSSGIESAKIFADLYSTNQIFEQVIDNAIKFTNKGSVSINLEVENGEYKIEVSDTGIGISNSYLEKVFDPFSQEEEGTNRTFEGNGLGLTLVKEYCHLNSFKIELKSQKLKGTTVTLKIASR